MADGQVIIAKALGLSVRFTERWHGYGFEDDEMFLQGEILFGDTVIFSTDMSHWRWALDSGRDGEIIESLIEAFKDKLDGETG